ncbi:MAG: lysine--tRNA ligase [Candidatus Eisenbacteria bacterium]|nr:lysine--tRNA ligase [Candidatus Eisenbacteria bacterium]
MSQTNHDQAQGFPELVRIRREKLAELEARGIQAYPHRFARTHFSAAIHDDFAQLEEKAGVACAGRVVSLRLMGRAAFFHLADPQGRIQVYVRRDGVGAEAYEVFRRVDLGDLVGVVGRPFRTRTGEITVRAEEFRFLAKSLRPMPVVKEKDGRRYDAFRDREARYRYRYLDLMLNPEVRETFQCRARAIGATRRFLEERGFLEVETPVLQYHYGGAMARPFLTHHNALDADLYLRIAEELPLKKLLVGGMERVYEIGKVFRNEGIDRMHNPEFTLLEFYWAYADYHEAMDLVEELVRHVARAATGAAQIDWGGRRVDLDPPFQRRRLLDLVGEALGEDPLAVPEERLRGLLRERGREVPRWARRGHLLEMLLDTLVLPGLEPPTFIYDYPQEISPLAKRVRDGKPGWVERFELFIAGQEIANSFSELNDPRDQRARLEAQMQLREEGDEEAQTYDADFVAALEHGMPPAAGVGIGVDRLIMLLTGMESIRDVVLFPHLKPLEREDDGGGEGSA